MALGTSFGQIIEMVQDECGSSSATSRGNDNRPYLKRVIKRHYETLCDSADWTFLRVGDDAATKTLQAGERYYDFPVAMDLRNVVTGWTFYGNVWVPLIYGIDLSDYNSMNPELDQRADPQIKWKVESDRQFEVWPLPASNGNLVRFTGKKLPNPLVADADQADMDDQLIVLYAAAEIQAKKKQADAEAKLAAARDRMIKCRAMYTDKRKARMGMGDNPADQRGWPRIRAFRASV